MKLYRPFFTLSLLFILNTMATQAQDQSGVDSTGLPGDQFSLQGALQLFSQSASIEDFEKALNLESNHVNNLDLNGDGETDYIRVIDKSEKEAHAFVLQVPVSASENQDIAVIELEKTGDTSAIAQIVGDEEIYGEAVIVEPDGGGEDDSFINYNNSRLSGPNAGYDYPAARVVINVWVWPSVRFVYGPVYRPWISPWRWKYYPAWWRPWRPFAWHVWHPYRAHYHRTFVVVRTHRVLHAHRVYTPFRSSSVLVRTRHSASVGHYRVTHTRTSVTGPRGKTTTVKKTTVTGPRGGKATKVKVRRH
ncbi:MAG: hypothetical protein HZA79_00900 [Sphingobacteriales bacterium]|nr:hypothetical protein [Sphingobacteriales bacterium]